MVGTLQMSIINIVINVEISSVSVNVHLAVLSIIIIIPTLIFLNKFDEKSSEKLHHMHFSSIPVDVACDASLVRFLF